MNQYIESFLRYMKEKGAPDNTTAAYRTDLLQLGTFVASHNGQPLRWDQVDRIQLAAYVLELGEKYADATIARKIATTRSFFEYLSAEGLVHPNPAETLASPRVVRSRPKPLSITQIDELLEQPMKRTTPEALRDRAMIELMYAAGLRNSELVALNVDDVNMAGPYICCQGRGKERTVPIHEQAAAAVQSYLNDGRSVLVKKRQESALFVNRRGQRLTRQGFWLILKQYAKAARIDIPVTPHTLRQTFADHLLRGGAPLRNVQELMGHANISTTALYQSGAAAVQGP